MGHISVKILNNTGESKKEYTRLTSHSTASVASVLKDSTNVLH